MGYPKPKCPPYEREYLDIQSREEDLETLGNIVDFYLEFGAFVEKETPDHIAVELEFMYYLIASELKALKDKTDDINR